MENKLFRQIFCQDIFWLLLLGFRYVNPESWVVLLIISLWDLRIEGYSSVEYHYNHILFVVLEGARYIAM